MGKWKKLNTASSAARKTTGKGEQSKPWREEPIKASSLG